MGKRTTTVIGCIVLGLVVTSCSTDGADSNDGDVTIRYEYWDEGQNEVIEKLAKKFMKANPDITVEPVQTAPSQYWTRLQTQTSGDNPPDVFALNGPYFQLYAANDTLLPLDEDIDNGDLDPANYPEDLISLYTYDESVYGMPVNVDTINLWYNKTLFDRADVEYPDKSWTWQDARRAAKKITEANPGSYGISAGSDSDPYFAQEGYYNTIAQAGGAVISEDGTESEFDEPAAVEGLQYWRDFIDDGSSPGFEQMVETPPSQMFQSGTVAMFYGGVWRAAQWRDSGMKSVDVTRMPSGPEGNVSTVHGTANVISSGTEHEEASRKFVQFMASKATQQEFGKSGSLIPAHDGTQQAWVSSMPQYNLQVYLDALDNTVEFPVSENTGAWTEPRADLLAPAWQKEADVSEVAEDVAEEMNDNLDEEGDQ